MRVTAIFAAFFALTLMVGVLAAETNPGTGKRVYINPSDSWQTTQSSSHFGRYGGGSGSGGAAPQTAEIIKTFGQRCPAVIVTSNKDRADFVVTLEHEGAKGLGKDSKVAVFNKDGDVIYSGSTRSIGAAVKDACAAIMK
jgi:hypothetical protein